jgi:2-isopropylmalate synthase
MSRIIFFDTTLRDGEQAPGGAMTLPQKIAIAQHLARLGVDVIEAGFPVSSAAAFEAVERIAAEVEGPTICALARASDADITAAGEALASAPDASRTRIHTFIATSDIHIDAKFSGAKYGATLEEKRRGVIERAVAAVKRARTYTADVEFSAEDAGRTDLGYLCEVVAAVIEAGATTINLPDTTGYCTPSEVEALFQAVIDCCGTQAPDGSEVVYSTHCHDDLGLAAANSLGAVLGGARQIECTVNGIGERAGNAALEEVVMALQVRRDRFPGVEHGLDTRELASISRRVALATGFGVSPNKAIVGANAFAHEAGIHQHGVLQRRDTYEIMRAEDVGQEAEQIRLGRHSGKHGFFARIERLGLAVEEGRRGALYQTFKDLADQKKEVYDEDLIHLFYETMQRGSSTFFALERIDAQTHSGSDPTATVRLRHERTGRVVEETATGDGPVDALYRAIDHATGSSHEMTRFEIRAASKGADALAEVTVEVTRGGLTFRGLANHPDTLHASAQAYLDALNRLEAHHHDAENVAFVGDGIMSSFG